MQAGPYCTKPTMPLQAPEQVFSRAKCITLQQEASVVIFINPCSYSAMQKALIVANFSTKNNTGLNHCFVQQHCNWYGRKSPSGTCRFLTLNSDENSAKDDLSLPETLLVQSHTLHMHVFPCNIHIGTKFKISAVNWDIAHLKQKVVFF